MGLFGYGTLKEKDALRSVGIVTLAIGAAAIVASIPLLVAGGTTVRDGKGKTIARRPRPAIVF
jgi:hypothetical protein